MLAQITNTARPALGQLLGQGKLEEAYQTYRHLFALSSGGAIVVGLSLWAGNGIFVPWWVGSQNYGGGWLDLALALNLIVHAWVLPNRAALSAGLKVRPMVINRLIEGLLNLVGAIILGIHFGLIGIVISTSISGIITTFWYLPRLTARMFNRRFIRFLFDDAVYALIASLLLAPMAWLARSLGVRFGGISGASLAMVCTGTIGLVFFWFIAFDHTLRGRVRNTFAMAWRTS